jgi:hypothetical protein
VLGASSARWFFPKHRNPALKGWFRSKFVTHDRLRTHDHESLFPFAPEPVQQDPEELIEWRQPWTGMPSLQCRELLAKSHIFKKHLVTSVEDSKDRTYKGPNGVDHATVLSHLAGAWLPCILLKSQAHRILANDSSRLGRSSVAESGNCRARAIPTTDSQFYPRQVQSGECTVDATSRTRMESLIIKNHF